MMQVNTMLLSFIGAMLSFGASFIHRLNILFIGTDDQHVLSYNSALVMKLGIFTLLLRDDLYSGNTIATLPHLPLAMRA